VEWPDPILNERARYVVRGRVFGRTVARDLLALGAALLLGMPLFEITLIYVLDALARSGEVALRIRMARGRPRGAIASPMFVSSDPSRPLDAGDPRAMARTYFLFMGFVVLLCGSVLILGILGEYGAGDTEPLRALVFWVLYTVPFFVYEHSRWMSDRRDEAVPHILARNLAPLILFASVMAIVLWGALAGVIAFVLLRALNESVDLVPSWSVDGVEWSTEWRGEWEALRVDRAGE
jgi:hypothetical protein